MLASSVFVWLDGCSLRAEIQVGARSDVCRREVREMWVTSLGQRQSF